MGTEEPLRGTVTQTLAIFSPYKNRFHERKGCFERSDGNRLIPNLQRHWASTLAPATPAVPSQQTSGGKEQLTAGKDPVSTQATPGKRGHAENASDKERPQSTIPSCVLVVM